MSGNFYSNELLTKILQEERMAEANAYRLIKQAEQSNASEEPASKPVFRPFAWLRQLALRMGGAGA